MRPAFPRSRRRRAAGLFAFGLMVGSGTCLHAQTITVPNGLPQGPIPTYEEVGLGGYTLPTSGGTRTIGGDGSTVSTSTVTSTGTDSDALQKMYTASWGYQAGQNAEALGVNPSALAATCVVESGCENLYTANANTSITGAFQMSNSTYTQELNKALAADPSLASTIVSGTAGQQDPATQAIAAAQYLKDGATYLEKNGVSSPTAVDVRAYYNYGPASGAAVANASDSDSMYSVLASKGYSADTLAKNGISTTETVGQWKSAVATKMGTAANASVLL